MSLRLFSSFLCLNEKCRGVVFPAEAIGFVDECLAFLLARLGWALLKYLEYLIVAHHFYDAIAA